MANTKISALTADTAPTADDLVVTVNDPGGTPATRKVTITNFTKAIPALIGDSGSGGTKGLAPAPAAGDAAANKFLHADGTYKTPAGSGAIGGTTGATDNALLRADGTGGATLQASAVTVDDNGAITVPEIAAPSTPISGKVAVYAKSDHKVYRKDSTGTETELGGGGSVTLNTTTNRIPQKTNSTTLDDSYLQHNSGSTRTESLQHFVLDTSKILGYGDAALARKNVGVIRVVSDTSFSPASIISETNAFAFPGGVPSPWASSGMNFRYVMTGNTTIGNPGGGATDGYIFTAMIVQSAGGGNTVTWSSAFKFAAGIAPTQTVTANAVDVYIFLYYSSAAYCIGIFQDVK